MKNQPRVSNSLINKWAPLINSQPNAATLAMMLENEEKNIARFLRQRDLKGPYYCDENGVYVKVEDVANPEYVPHAIFTYHKYETLLLEFINNLILR